MERKDETKKTFKQVLEEAKKNKNGKVTWAITMKDMPVDVAEKFLHNIEREYNAIYWVKLKELMLKAEMYDLNKVSNIVPEISSNEGMCLEENAEASEYIQTMGGKIRIGEKK